MVSLLKLGILVGGVLLLSIIYLILQRIIHKDVDKQRRSVFRKLTRIIYFVILIIFISLVLGYDVSNVWLGLGSVIGLVAIGFVAVWSMLGNIFAGIIIFASKPFKIDQKIQIVDSGTTGIVDDITLFYTVLKNEDGNYVHIQNTAFFQKEFITIINEPKKKSKNNAKKKK